MTGYLGHATLTAGRDEEARRLLTEVLAYFPEQAEPFQHARALSGLADVHLRVGELKEADRSLATALSICRLITAYHQEANVLAAMAHLAEQRGDAAACRQHMKDALRLYRLIEAPEADQIATQLAEQQ